MPVDIKLVTGGRKGRPISSRSASNAASAGFFAPRRAFTRMMRDILWLTCTIVTGAGFVLKSVRQGSSKWSRRRNNAGENGNGGIGSYW